MWRASHLTLILPVVNGKRLASVHRVEFVGIPVAHRCEEGAGFDGLTLSPATVGATDRGAAPRSGRLAKHTETGSLSEGGWADICSI